VQTFICHFLHCIYDFDLVLLAYSVSSSDKSPPSGGGGSSIAGAPKADGPQDTIEAHNSKGATVGAASGDRALISGTTIGAGAVAQVVAGDGFLTLEVLPEGDINVTVGEMAAGDPTISTGPAGGASPSTTVADDDVDVEESRVILGHPMLRAPGVVSLDKVMGTACWCLPRHMMCSTGRVEASTMNSSACCYGLPCSRSGQQQRVQGWRQGSNTLT
jgi:hypothetical protein